MKHWKIFILLCFVILAGSCSLKPRGWWTEGIIAVMADSTDWLAVQGQMRRTFERVVRTPQIENIYTLKYVTKPEFERYTEYRYLVLAGTLESGGRVGELVNRVIADPEIRNGVENGEYYVFTQRNQWAKDQLMVILVAKDIPTLREKIITNAPFLYNVFDTDFKDRMDKDLKERSFTKEQEKKLLISNGWTITLQKDYFLAQEFPEEGFAWFRRLYPERWIFVRWIDGGDTTLLNPHWIVGERNSIGSEYFSGESVVNRYLFSTRGTFLGRTAQITTGLWENISLVKGGPFKNYTFFDPLSRRVYMIDIAVHAPGQDKVPFLRRMDVIAATFRTVFDG